MMTRKVSGTSPARQKMIDVMTLKGLAPKTQQNYQHTLSKLAVDYGRPPQRLTADEVSSWVIGRIDAGLEERTTNANVSALRLFFNDAMGQPDKVAGLHGRRVHDRLPRSISEANVLVLIQGIYATVPQPSPPMAPACGSRK